jgi:hypothetical protein
MTDPDPGGPKFTDPDPQHWYHTLLNNTSMVKYMKVGLPFVPVPY